MHFAVHIAETTIDKMIIMMLDPRYKYITRADDCKLDMARQDFEQEWQEAFTREELANAILLGIFVKPNTNDWLDFGNYDIRNQAKLTGDLYYRQRSRLEQLRWSMYWNEELQTEMI